MQTFHFDKLYSVDRIAEPCTLAIPFSPGEFQTSDSLVIYQDGSVLPSQQKITGVYSDGSVRYLFVRFLADLPANKKCTLQYDILKGAKPEQKQASQALTVSVDLDSILIQNSTISFTVKNNSASLFDTLSYKENTYSSDRFVGPFLKTDISDSLLFANYHTWRIVEEGEICVILSCLGTAIPCNPCDDSTTHLPGEGFPIETRLTVYAGKPWFEVSFRLFNSTGSPVEISAYRFSILPISEYTAGVRTCVADSNYRTSFTISEEGNPVEKSINATFLKGQGNEHFPEVFYGTFFADRIDSSCGICATIFQAHQNFPKAIRSSRDGIDIFLIPDEAAITMQSGMAREQKILLHFHDSEASMDEFDSRSLIYQMPDRALLSPAAFEKLPGIADIFVHNKNYDVEDVLISCADGHGKAYGMMNWGDAPDANYTGQGRGHGRPVWTNNEYDFPHAAFLLYAKTGIRRFLDYAIVTGTHQMDVDVCHYSENPLEIGGQWEHTHGHCVEGVMVCSHQWLEGILDCYHMTGDERFLETALGIGENVLRLLDTPMYQTEGSFNARETGWALRSLTALYTETHDEKWLGKSEWIVSQFKDWADRYGGWLAPYTDNTLIRVPFMISVAVGSLMRYYREKPSADLKNMILHAVDDLVENCIMEDGMFFYKELPSLQRTGTNPLTLEALAIAYELTGNAEYLKKGLPTYRVVLKRIAANYNAGKQIIEDAVTVGNQSPKTFAQAFIPVATYYKALERAGMLQ